MRVFFESLPKSKSAILLTAAILNIGMLWTLTTAFSRTTDNSSTNTDGGSLQSHPATSLIEAGPTREYGNLLIGGYVWGRRTIHANGQIDFTVRISIANIAWVFPEEIMREFLTFTEQVEQHADSHITTEGANVTVAAWEGIDLFNSTIRITYSYEEKIWQVDDLVQPGLIPSIKAALADIDQLRTQKVSTPW